MQGDDAEQTRLWFQTLQFYSQSLGGWRKRRKGLGNIMIDPNLISPGGGEGTDADASPEGAGAVRACVLRRSGANHPFPSWLRRGH